MKKPRQQRGEDYLDRVRAITLTLEDGEKVTLPIRPEVAIPEDPVRLERAARRAAAKLAFWAYQTELALSRVRKAELVVSEAEGREYEVFRRYYLEEGRTPTEPMLKAAIDHLSPKVRTARIALNARRREYGVLRSIRDAVDHRSWILGAFLKKRES